MAFFTKVTPLAAAVAAGVKLCARFADAKVATTSAVLDRNALAIAGGDDAALAAAEATVRNRLDRESTLTAAIAENNVQVAQFKAMEDEEADHKARSETVIQIHKQLAEIERAERELFAAISRMKTVTEWAHLIVPEAAGVQSFLTVAEQQIPDAMALINRCIREHAAAILRREASATMRKVEVPVKLVVVMPPTQMVFSLHAITWIDHAGAQRVLSKWNDAELPISEALFALKAKLAVLPTDERCKKLRGLSQGHPEPSWLNNLTTKIGPNIEGSDTGNDSVAPQAAVDPIKASSPFTVVDRGPEYQLRGKGN
jgi:hypothetical protein